MGLLVEDCVDGNRGLASLAITDDQLSLATADWDQAVDSFQAGGPAQGYLVSHTSQCGAGRSFLRGLQAACMQCKNLHPVCHGLVHALPGNDAGSLRIGTLPLH